MIEKQRYPHEGEPFGTIFRDNIYTPTDTPPKYDADKPRLDLVPPAIIEAVGKVRTYGITKYADPDNWRQVGPERYQAALMRHLCEYMRNPLSIDDESGLPHLWHMACNIAFLCELSRED